MILVIKHIDIEGPGSIEKFLSNTAQSIKVIDLSAGQKLPANLKGIEAVISLGGPMNVYEEDKYPFLKEEDKFLKEAVKEEIPVLGICLGAQLLAKASGAKVKKSDYKEVGWYRVELTEEGKKDPLFKNVPEELCVFQWHEDTFDVPKGGVLLVKGSFCLNQAFRFGRNAYGLQFHMETTPEMIESWINEYTKEGDKQAQSKNMLIEAYKKNAIFERQAGLLCLNFAGVIRTGGSLRNISGRIQISD